MSPHLRVIFLALLLFSGVARALEVPPAPTEWVTDRADILSEANREALNAKLRSFEERSGAQFIIYIFPSLQGDSLEDFTIRAAERWKVGQKKYDNGLILFVFVEDRRTRIETGYGLEGTITDAYASRVLRETLAPYFRRGDYAGGLHAAADQLIARIEGREPPVPVARPAGTPTWSWSDVLVFMFVLLLIVIFLGPMLGRAGCGGCLFPFVWPGGVTFGGGGGRWSGGGFGGGFSGGGGSFGGGGASGSW